VDPQTRHRVLVALGVVEPLLGAAAMVDLLARRTDPWDPAAPMVRKFNPGQPRVPGGEHGGEWTISGALKGFAEKLARAVKGRDALDAPPADFRHGSKRGIDLTPSELKALEDYANDAQRINDQIRRNKMTARTKTTVRQMDRVMARSKLPDDVEVWRGATSGRAIFGDRMDGDLTGFEWDEVTPLSTAADRRVAEEYAGMFDTPEPVLLMRILAPEGTGAVTMSGWGSGSALDEQSEIVLERGLSPRVVTDHGVIDHPRIPAGVRLVDVMLRRG